MSKHKITKDQLREWEKKLFPTKCIGRELSSPNEIDDEHIEYCIGTWCCNSLNAVGGLFRHFNRKNTTNCIITANGERYPLVSYRQCESVAILFDRAQSVINYLQAKIEFLEAEREDDDDQP